MSVERSMAAGSAPTVRTERPKPARSGVVDAAEPIRATHRVTYSDRLKLFIGADEAIDNFLRPLRRLDGHHRYSIQLTRLPAPLRSADITPAISSAPGRDYLRCIGSADTLVVELHTVADGTPRRSVVGRAERRDGEPSICVQVPEGMAAPWIHPAEAFAAEEAAEIFAAYFRTGTIPSGLVLREATDDV
ncbi:hypothetical protein DFR70_102514 [Nocardia tenerifensis]|uniref:Uncharacterized protein n=1 Tax=Nocardia tenerifensis TaxID=228006 RepID=A0A318K650_9NOCA|nr:hypothetical protein [Nocardia tenerifensis]PXX68828.1 hypothetical protein DFR70_102514 [Nocardia tenerifensis]